MPSRTVVIGVVVVVVLLVTFSAYNYLEIGFPSSGGGGVFSYFESFFNAILSIPRNIQRIVIVPFYSSPPPTSSSPSPSSSATASSSSSNTFKYTIQSGDTFYALASKYCTSVTAIENANPGVNPNDLQVGQIINMPYGCGGTLVIYTIQAGDTFYALSLRYCTSVSLIELVNPGVNPNDLYVGQKVNIPSSCTSSSSSTTTTTTTTTSSAAGPYYGMNNCSQSGCPASVFCVQASSDSISTSSYTNSFDSCFLGGAAFFGYSSYAGFAKAEGVLESGLNPKAYSEYDSFPGPCGYSGWDPMTNYATQDASHSLGLMQLTPACTGWFATYSVSQGQSFGVGNCVGTGSNMRSIPYAQYFYCQPEGEWYSSSTLANQYYADVATSGTLYSKSAYNPAYNIWSYWEAIYSIYASTLNGGSSNGDGNLWSCTANQRWYIVIAAYNQGSIYNQLYDANGQGAKCVLESWYNGGGWNGYNYVLGILSRYQQLYGSYGPFSQFPYY